MKLPSSKPIDDPEGVWTLQLQLLHLAEGIFGPRDSLLKSYQPQFADGGSLTILSGLELCRPRFTEDGPQINFDFDKKWVFAELSTNGEYYWPTVLYELAHETIHLLNPGTLGTANYLEEGVAVAFSIYAQLWFSTPRIQTPSEGSKYDRAFRLVNALPGPLLTNTSRIRRDVGRFSEVKPQDLVRLFPDIDMQLANELTRKFSVVAGS